MAKIDPFINEVFYKELGGRLLAVRKERRICLKDIASYLEVSYQQYQKYEAGITRIPLDRFLRLMRLYKLNMSRFLEGTIY
jgi:transcriptional regulator with XRE-family HTH domain